MDNPLRPRDPRQLSEHDTRVLYAIAAHPGCCAAEIADYTLAPCKCWPSRIQKIAIRLEALGFIERRKVRRVRMDGSAHSFVCFYPKEAA
jgi:DNA-binding MarR family transcriptional regulator